MGHSYDDADELYFSAMHFLNRPHVAYERYQKARDDYYAARSRAISTSMTFDEIARLGCRVQTSKRNIGEDAMLGLMDYEREYDRCKMMLQCELITIRNAIFQIDMPYTSKKILYERAKPSPKTYEQLANELRLKNKQQAQYIERKAISEFAVQCIAKNGFYGYGYKE